jgi:hypothetical protein
MPSQIARALSFQDMWLTDGSRSPLWWQGGWQTRFEYATASINVNESGKPGTGYVSVASHRLRRYEIKWVRAASHGCQAMLGLAQAVG